MTTNEIAVYQSEKKTYIYFQKSNPPELLFDVILFLLQKHICELKYKWPIF